MSKINSMAMVVSIAGALSAASARAQTFQPSIGAATPVAYENADYYADEGEKSPSDKPPMPVAPKATEPAPSAAAPTAPIADAAACGCNTGGCGSGGDCCKLTCPD